MEKGIFLSVVIPAYNEERRIGRTLEALDSYFKKQIFDYEIIVVSDGSKDKTADIVNEYAKKIKGLRIIANEKNHGKGYVVRQGMREAEGKFRLFMDADNSVPVEYVDEFLPYFSKGYDVAIASIEVAGAKIEEHAAWYRRALGHYSKLLIRALAIWEIRDTQRGFKMFSARAAKDVFSLQTIIGFGFDIEILVIAKQLGYTIKELPVAWNNPGESKVGLSAYFATFKELFRIRKNMTGKAAARVFRRSGDI
ncbi:glycosyltransferase family 2 protein [Candidatus Azambacteria bacterium]|nr:glycosyltransferase family 2 protein [Candidatus Azambacteria bacterium]